MRRRDVVLSGSAALAAAFAPIPAAAQGARAAKGYIRTNWSRDPYALGSYSFIAKGALRRHYRDMGKPVGDRLFFAGEATHPRRNSTVHAALESGRIAAKAVRCSGAAHVAVIGAGVAGLTAAHEMSEAGLDVTVFEARNRIGGRIWTDRRLGLPLDLGASWIHGTRGNPLTPIVRDLGMQTKATDDSYVMRGEGGRIVPDAQEPEWLFDVTEVQQTAGAALSELNWTAYINDDDYDGPEVIFPGGYDGLFEALNDAFEVQFGVDVRQVAYDDAGVRLTDARGRSAEFDAVVVTVPLGVLKAGHIRFTPDLPQFKKTAIARLGMGLLDKVYLRYDRVFWDREATWIITPENGLPPGQFNQWFNIAKFTGDPVILAFNGGPPARDMAKFSDAKMVRLAQDVLAGAYPG